MVRAYLDKAPCAARVGFTDSREKRESGVGASNCPDTYMRDLVCLCAGRYTLARLLGRTSTPISAVTGRGPRHRPAGEEQVARFLRPRWPLSRTTLLCFEQLAARLGQSQDSSARTSHVTRVGWSRRAGRGGSWNRFENGWRRSGSRREALPPPSWPPHGGRERTSCRGRRTGRIHGSSTWTGSGGGNRSESSWTRPGSA